MSESLINFIKSGDLQIVRQGLITTGALSVAFPGANYGYDFREDTFNHNLGYTPIVLCFVNFTGSYEIMPFVDHAGGGTAGTWKTIVAYTDDTTLTIQSEIVTINASANFSAVPVKYFLLRIKSKN